ncbi:MAG: aspartate aminotransferase family protein [Gammaproteobacteria bacterium]|nr:aspartate aminotransferase family protein [Gammaproteobacteria bacterium]
MAGYFDAENLEVLGQALARLQQGFAGLPAAQPETLDERGREALLAAADRLTDNYPYFHPLYVGQMLKPPHPVARLAYALTMYINPNNHALDGGRASSQMEKEVVADIGAMFGWEQCLGHLTSGGTMANFEALWIGRELRPGTAVAASAQSHYTHPRLSAVLGVPFVEIAVDAQGRMDPADLQQKLGRGDIGTVVATLGTTAAGAVDPLSVIADLCRQHDVQLHVDTAYGGYYRLCDNLGSSAAEAYEAIGRADSIVVDPHKHGLQPYGCGCVLFRDPAAGRFYQHDSPYTYFSSDDLHLGEISLECSRAGAAAVALWTTMQALPAVPGGEFARSLQTCREAALQLHAGLLERNYCKPLFAPELDIVVWAVPADTASESSRRAQEIFSAAANHDLHLAVAGFPRAMCEAAGAVQEWDQESLTCLRACVMKPEHHDWVGQILQRLDLVAKQLELT